MVITVKVIWLDTASHIVKLETGSVLDGIRNGNNAKPAVKIAPTIARVEPKNVNPALILPAEPITISEPRIAIIGAIMVIGYKL